MKREYTITMPFTGIATRVIEAESEDEAVDKFLADTTMPLQMPQSEQDAEVLEWDFCRHIIEGNVFYGVQNKMEVEEGPEVED